MSKKPKGPPKDLTPKAFFLRFVRSDNKGRNICVYDGQHEVSRWTGRAVKKETWVPVKYIEGRDSFWARSLGPRTDIAIVIPAWVAEELGLKDANNLQHAEAYERGRRIHGGSGADGGGRGNDSTHIEAIGDEAQSQAATARDDRLLL